jgi:hypothetical protein
MPLWGMTAQRARAIADRFANENFAEISVPLADNV